MSGLTIPNQRSKKTVKILPSDIEEIEKLIVKNPAVAKLYDLYKMYTEDVSMRFYKTIVLCEKHLSDSVENKKLDLDDQFIKSIVEVLKAGDKISKTLTAAKIEAGIIERESKSKDTAATSPEEDVAEEKAVVPITAETASVHAH